MKRLCLILAAIALTGCPPEPPKRPGVLVVIRRQDNSVYTTYTEHQPLRGVLISEPNRTEYRELPRRGQEVTCGCSGEVEAVPHGG